MDELAIQVQRSRLRWGGAAPPTFIDFLGAFIHFYGDDSGGYSLTLRPDEWRNVERLGPACLQPVGKSVEIRHSIDGDGKRVPIHFIFTDEVTADENGAEYQITHILSVVKPEAEKLVWKFRPEPIRRKSRQAFVSALLVADKLYWGVEGHLYVLSKETGKLQWEFYDESAPRLFTHGHERVSEEGQTFLAAAEGTVYIADKQVMFALSAETGQLRWKRFIPNLHSFLQVRPGRVYVSSMDEDFNRLLHALRADTGETDWRIRTEGPEARYVFDEDQIYIKSHAGLRRVSAETGELQWEFLRPAPTPHEIIVGNPLSHSRQLSETKGFLPAGWLAGGYGDRTGV